jgi:hypothetical protein
MRGHVACKRDMRNAYNILVGKTEWRLPFGILRRRWEDNIKIDRRGIGWEGGDWIHPA